MADLHPWLSTPEALAAAERAVRISVNKMGAKALVIGADELLSEALAILTECALPPRERQRTLCAKCGGPLEGVRAGAKFCSPKCRMGHAKNVQRQKAEVLPSRPGAHIGSMWSWPEEERSAWAAREVGFVLNNYLRTRRHAAETPMSEALANMNVAVEEGDEDAREFLTRWLEDRGFVVEGEESFAELAEAAKHARAEARVAPRLADAA